MGQVDVADVGMYPADSVRSQSGVIFEPRLIYGNEGCWKRLVRRFIKPHFLLFVSLAVVLADESVLPAPSPCPASLFVPF